MKKEKLLFPLLGLSTLMMVLTSCDDDNDTMEALRPTALVTVCPETDGSFIMQLDNTTQLVPVNMKQSPFEDKEVRALVNYTEAGGETAAANIRNVQVHWIDSIRTKMPVESVGEDNDDRYGNDPVEIVRDWVTVAEDGYLTLRVRTLWGTAGEPHILNLLTGTNPSDPYELELRHDAQGDVNGYWGDALIAFNLNKLPREDSDTKKFTLKWKSFSGEKSLEFDIQMRPVKPEIDPRGIKHSKAVR